MSRDKIDISAFEAASADLEAGGEQVTITRRSTGTAVVELRLHHMGRTLRGTYTLSDRDLTDEDVEELFRECYLRTYTERYYADKVDQIELTTPDGEVKFRFDHP